jgi:hypothetical protein
VIRKEVTLLHRLAGKALARLIAMVLVATVVGAIAARASAMDGRVPDGRTLTPGGEITAMYWHGLNRDPDQGGFNNYMWFVNRNCRWGILDGSFKILNSGEAHDIWRNDPQTMAGMLYAALLNRPPDLGGLATYTAAIRQRGLEWATAAMMGSREYNLRLKAICANPNETATMYGWQEAQAFSRDTLMKRAENLAIVCGANTAIRTAIGQLKDTPWPPTIAIGRIGWVTNQMINAFGWDGTCGAALQFLLAARHVNETILSGQGNNPVFIQWTVESPHWFTGQRPFTIRVGPNPTLWKGFSGKAW